MTEKRKERITSLYMRIKAIESNLCLSCTKAQIITEAIAENVTTTQLNQINISLSNKLAEYFGGK